MPGNSRGRLSVSHDAYLAIGENRFELLMVEVQEERERHLHAIVMALGAWRHKSSWFQKILHGARIASAL